MLTTSFIRSDFSLSESLNHLYLSELWYCLDYQSIMIDFDRSIIISHGKKNPDSLRGRRQRLPNLGSLGFIFAGIVIDSK